MKTESNRNKAIRDAEAHRVLESTNMARVVELFLGIQKTLREHSGDLGLNATEALGRALEAAGYDLEISGHRYASAVEAEQNAHADE